MKEYTPSGKTPEELAAEIKKPEEESENMTEWPDVDNYVDDLTTMHAHRGFLLPIFRRYSMNSSNSSSGGIESFSNFV